MLACGQKWSRIAAVLTGRTDDAVRNRYLRLVRKKAEAPGVGGGGAAGSNGKAFVTSEDLKASEVAKRGDMWSPEEDTTIIHGVNMHGLKWQVIAQQLPGRSANAVRNRYLRCLPQDGAGGAGGAGALKTPRPKAGPSPGSYYHGASQPRLGEHDNNPNNAPLRPTVHAPLQQTRAAPGTYPPPAAARAREDGLLLMGRAPPPPPQSPANQGQGGFSLHEIYGAFDGAGGSTFDAEVQGLLGSGAAEAQQRHASMTTGLFG